MVEFPDFPEAPPPAETVAQDTATPDVVAAEPPVENSPLPPPVPPTIPQFELSVADLNVQSGTVAVTWCISPELLKGLADQGVRDPQVVIVTATADEKKYHITKEYRTVAPLKDMLAYVEFRSSGTNRVYGFVSFQSKKEARSRYLRRSDGAYRSNILSDSGDKYQYGWENPYHAKGPELADPLTVEVPAGVFAPEPSQFEKNWVNWMFRTKCVDQCAFRRRRMFAYTVQPLLLVLNVLVAALFLVGNLLVGARGTTLKYLLHPLTYSWLDLPTTFNDGSIFVQKMDPWYYDTKQSFILYLLKKFWALPFMPVILAPLVFVIWMTAHAHMAIIYALAIIAGAALTIFLGYLLFAFIVDWFAKRAAELAKLPPWYMEKDEMELIMCSNPNKPKSFKDLPAKKKVFRLYFQDLKSKVCRPFSA